VAVPAILVVYPAGAVYTQTYVKTRFSQKRTPFVVEEESVCLQVVPATPPVGQIMILQFHSQSVEVKARESRFATVPSEIYNGSRTRFYVTADKQFQYGVRHSRQTRAIVGILCFQIVTVAACKIAARTDGLCHDDERRRRFA
jgi:hypothetical protein